MTEYTWEPITIKPNDQSLVGEVVKQNSWDDCNAQSIEDIGNKYIILMANGHLNISLISNINWLIRREVKKKEKKVWAYGWLWNSDRDERWLTTMPVSKETYESYGKKKIWPAKMNSDGTFTEPDDE